MYKITQILENVVRCKYFEACVHIKNPIKNSYQDGLGRTTQTLDHVVMVHILIWEKRSSPFNEYNDIYIFYIPTLDAHIIMLCISIPYREGGSYNFLRLLHAQGRDARILVFPSVGQLPLEGS
jgi:hypothetical protein